MSPWVPRVLLVLVAGAVIGAIVSISVGEGGPRAIEIEGGDEVITFYAGMPQEGRRLGEPEAPVEIDVFTDLRSTDSMDFHAETVAPLIEEFVRPGDALINLRHRSVGGSPVSLPAVAATIAGEQERQWQFADLVLRNLEHAGAAADEDFLLDVADVLRGLTRDFETEEFAAELEPCADAEEATECPAAEVPRADDELATELELTAEPALVVTGPGGSETLMNSPSLEDARAAIERVAAAP
ncbi:MAG TPA: thioredoxin domain-containing protein [Solirubrobacterales bacterium]